jgi:GTPase SAR1 family protein
MEDAGALKGFASNLSHGLFNMIVLGTFKNGKSTLLNALLGSKTLPARAAPATAIITILVRGESKDVTVYELEKDEPRVLSWDEFFKEFQLTKEDQETLEKNQFLDRFQQIRHAQIECMHPLVDNGVKLIDSPGLEEHISRTKVTTNFLKQSQAVILVLDATKILSQAERKFIEQMLGEGRLNNVFFVINKLNLLEDDDANEIREYVQRALKHHFLDEAGNFDEEFYQRRVFFVNAKGALDARIAGGSAGDHLEATGVPGLEKALERFLTSEEKVRAALASAVQYLIYVTGKARKKIAEDKVALVQPLGELEQRRVQSEQALKELERKKEDVERTILLVGDTVKQKVYANLMDYLREIRDTWPQDALMLEHMPNIGFKRIAKSTISSSAKQELTDDLQSDMQHYIEWKLNEWQERIPTIIHSDIEMLQKEVEAQLEEFQINLDKVTKLFSSGAKSIHGMHEVEEGKVSKFIQAGWSVVTLDVSGVAGSVMGEGKWSSFFGRLLQQIILVNLVSIIFPPAGLAILVTLAIDALFARHHINKFKEKFIENFGNEVNETLQKELTQKQDEIYASVAGQFSEIADKLTTNLAAQIKETRAGQEKIIKAKKDAGFSIEKEQKRLDAVGVKLVELFDLMSQAAYGKSYSLEELDRLATAKAESYSHV